MSKCCKFRFRVRDSIGAYCQQWGYQYEIWARTEFDMHVKKYPDIVEEFFYTSPVVTPTVLHQLAFPPRDFTGRTAELDQLQSVA